MQFLDKETSHYVMDGDEKVQEGFVLLESKKKKKSSFTVFAAAAFGLVGPQKKLDKEEPAEVRAKTYLNHAMRIRFTAHPGNPKTPTGPAANPKCKKYIKPEHKDHWTRQQHMFFLKGFNDVTILVSLPMEGLCAVT